MVLNSVKEKCVHHSHNCVCFTVVLMENGDVYTFGYGQHGQLGHGDINSRYLKIVIVEGIFFLILQDDVKFHFLIIFFL